MLKMNFVKSSSPRPIRSESLQSSTAKIAAFRRSSKNSIPDRPYVSTTSRISSSTSGSTSLSVTSLATLSHGKEKDPHPTKDVPDIAETSIPLEKYYCNLRNRGIAGQHWMLFDANGHVGKQVSFDQMWNGGEG